MSETITAKPDGAMLPLDSLAQTFTWDGNRLHYITVEYPPSSGDFYRQTFTYLPGFSIASVAVTDPGIFYSISISTSGPGSGATFVPSYEMVVADPDLDNQGVDYEVGDVITLVGGDFSVAAVATVSVVGVGGNVLEMTVTTPGVYSTLPVAPVLTSGGTGTGLRMAPSFGLLSITVGIGGAGYDETSEMVFTGDYFSLPTADITLSDIDTGGQVQTISAWEKQ